MTLMAIVISKNDNQDQDGVDEYGDRYDYDDEKDRDQDAVLPQPLQQRHRVRLDRAPSPRPLPQHPSVAARTPVFRRTLPWLIGPPRRSMPCWLMRRAVH